MPSSCSAPRARTDSRATTPTMLWVCLWATSVAAWPIPPTMPATTTVSCCSMCMAMPTTLARRSPSRFTTPARASCTLLPPHRNLWPSAPMCSWASMPIRCALRRPTRSNRLPCLAQGGTGCRSTPRPTTWMSGACLPMWPTPWPAWIRKTAT